MNLLLAALVVAASLAAPPPQTQPPASPSDAHHRGVEERGDTVMGFSRLKTTHHFRLYKDGGAIEAEANDTQDTGSRDQIRRHFRHIVQMFAAGNFSAPFLVHQQDPPGTADMARLRDQIHYSLDETPRGGRIRITTQNAEAVRALHAFLRFQIRDHHTGDSTEITKAP